MGRRLSDPSRAVAIASWRGELGEAAVSTDAAALAAYQLNASQFRPREIIAILRPSSLEDVRRIIAVARYTGVLVHPISSGRNWGFGSALPAQEPAAVVDLAGMNRIVDVNRGLRWAVIEPGVTQGQLSDHLTSLGGGLALNVTGAGRDTSITGNVLDNGGGNRGLRAEDLLGAEVVLGTGDVVRTGLWHLGDGGDAVHCYPPGLGPDLRGLFIQSTFGIVTKIALRLHRASPFLELTAEVPGQALAELIEELRLARDDGLITGYARVSDGTDPHIRLFPGTAQPAWTAQIIVRGTSAIRCEAGREIEHRLQRLACRIVTFDTEHGDLANVPDGDRPALEARVALQDGIPSDRSLAAAAAAAGKHFTGGGGRAQLDLDEDLPGFLCANVVLPFCGNYATQCADIVAATAAEMTIPASRQFGVISATALSGFAAFWFDRRDEREVVRAHRFKDELLRRLERAGIWPMRLDIDSAPRFIGRTGGGYWNAVAAIAGALDPDGIFAGHYDPRAPRTTTGQEET